MTQSSPRTSRRPAVLAGALAAVSLALGGCGLSGANGFTPVAEPGSIRQVDAADGVKIAVGAKNYTEQLILGKMAVIALRTAGYTVTDRTNIPGSQPTRQAILTDETQVMWDYTGVAWVNYMGHEKPVVGDRAQYEAVRDEDRENGLTWLKPAPMNNTYAFAVREEALPGLGDIEDLAQLSDLPVEARTLCVESEFASRTDGLRPLLEDYGIPLGEPDGIPRDNVRVLDTGAVYTATDSGNICNFGEVFTTDGRIRALDLSVLTDSKKYFPSYNVAPIVRTPTLEEHPELADIFDPISAKITTEVMLDLNGRVDVGGEDYADVALAWLKEEGFVE